MAGEPPGTAVAFLSPRGKVPADVTSTYRDDRAVIEERLAQLEASHVERQINGLRRLRSLAEAETPPTSPTKAPVWLPVGYMLLNMLLMGSDALRSKHLVSLLVLGCCCFVGASLVILSKSKPYLVWRHRRKQQRTLAKLDAEMAALEHTRPLRVEPKALEAARIRIAELEEEEEAAEEQMASARAARTGSR